MIAANYFRPLTLIVALWMALPVTAQAAERPPVEAFASLPGMSRPALSPDGSRIESFQMTG